MGLKAIIFDVDGTLGETETVHQSAFNEAFRHCGLDWVWDEEIYIELLRIPGGPSRLQHFVETRYPEDLERMTEAGLLTRIHRRKTQNFARMLEDSGVSLRAGVSRLITDARSAGVKLAACTTSQLETFEILVVNALGIEALSWFNAVVTGADVKKMKPDPEGYLEVLRRLRVDAGDAVVIEDTERGVEAARAAGIRVIAVPSEMTSDEDFSRAEIMLSDLGEPASPFDVLAGDPMGFGYASLRAIRTWLGDSE